MNKKALSFVLSSVMVLASVTTAFAATGDVYNQDGTSYATGSQITLSKAKKAEVTFHPEKYTYEYEGGVKYQLTDANDAFNNADGDMTKFADTIKEKTPVTPGTGEVKSVVGLTDTVDTATDTTLEFAINGGAVPADLVALKEAGYTVKFLASAKVFSGTANESTTGLVANGLSADVTFKYQVRIFKGIDKVAESELKTVTVVNKASTITEITAINLYVEQSGTDAAITSGKLATGDSGVKVVVMGKTAADKTTDASKDITAKVTLSSDKAGVVAVANGALTIGANGTAVITAKAGDLSKTLSISTGNAERAIDASKSTVTPKTLQLATGQAEKITLIAKDQYGDVFVPAINTITFAAVTADGSTIVAGVSTSDVGDKDGKVVVTATADSTNAGLGELILTAEGGTVKLATITVQVTKPGETVKTWKLEKQTGDNATVKDGVVILDMKAGADNDVVLNLIGYDEKGLKNKTQKITDASIYTLEFENKGVVALDADTGTVTGAAVGKTSVRVYKTDDSFKETIAAIPVTVIDTTPVLSGVTFKKVADQTVASGDAIDLAAVIEKLTITNADGTAAENDSITGAAINVEGLKVGDITITNSAGKTVIFGVAGTGNDLVVNGSGKIEVAGAAEAKTTITITVVDINGNYVGDISFKVTISA